MTMPDVSGLPENLDATYTDDAANPSRKAHQQHHDLLHGAVKALLPREEASGTYAAKRAAIYADFTAMSDGTPTALTSGEAVTVFGKAPLTILDGRLMHVPFDGANSAGYMQAASLTDDVTTIGATVEFPAGAVGAAVLVLPLNAWSNNTYTTAGVHFVMYGNGEWHVSNWNGSSEDLYAEGTAADMRDGVARTVELTIDRTTSTLTIFLPDGTTSTITDSRVVSNTSQHAVWELYEGSGSGPAVCAQFVNAWAQTADEVLTPPNPALASRSDIARAVNGARRTIMEFTASASGQTLPADCLGVYVSIIAPGGGGGSGRRGAAGTVRCGGGAGGAGGIIHDQWIPADLLGPTFAISISNPGTGGAAVTTDDTNGNAGTSGGTATFSSSSVTLKAIGGGGGAAGTTSSGTGGNAGAPLSTGGASASGTGGTGSSGSLITTGAPGQAGAGGGITSGNVAGNGGAGSATYIWGASSGGSAGVVDGAVPGTGPAPLAARPGDGPGGGAASITTAAQAGAVGTGYGNGGGGGGASLNGNASGAGGNGGPGYVRVTLVRT